MNTIYKIIAGALLCSIFWSCKKEYDAIGLDMIGNNLLGSDFTDTISINSYSLLGDSVNTTYLSNVILGHLKDPVFGNSKTGIYLKYYLSESSVNFGNNPILDSLVFTMQYSGYYGDTNARLSLEIFELSELLDEATAYYSNNTTPYIPQNLTYHPSFSFTPRPNTTVIIDTIKYVPHLRVRLSDELGQRLINNQSVLASNDAFQQFFKGLYITASTTSSEGCLVYLYPRGSISTITLYYRNETEGQKRYVFNIPSTSTYYSHFDLDHEASTNSDFRRQVLGGEQSLGKKLLYTQAMGGIRTFLEFPHLSKSFQDQKVIINKAELVITNVAPNAGNFIYPPSLSIQMKTENGLSYIPDDEVFMGSTYYGGTYNASDNTYRFRITQYVQRLIHDPNYGQGLYLIVRGGGIRGNRLIFGGTAPDDPDSRIRLDLHYTTY